MLRLLCFAFFCAILPCRAADKNVKLPPAGTVFQFSPDAPKFVTCDIEFRDTAGRLWPSFCYGKPAAVGKLAFDARSPQLKLEMKCDRMTQLRGDQSRRVLGELVLDEKPPLIVLTIVETADIEVRSIEVEEKGKMVVRSVDTLPVKARLTIDGKAWPVSGYARMNYRMVKGKDAPESVAVDLHFRVDGAAIGLKDAASSKIAIRAALTGYVELPTDKKK